MSALYKLCAHVDFVFYLLCAPPVLAAMFSAFGCCGIQRKHHLAPVGRFPTFGFIDLASLKDPSFAPLIPNHLND